MAGALRQRFRGAESVRTAVVVQVDAAAAVAEDGGGRARWNGSCQAPRKPAVQASRESAEVGAAAPPPRRFQAIISTTRVSSAPEALQAR